MHIHKTRIFGFIVPLIQS